MSMTSITLPSVSIWGYGVSVASVRLEAVYNGRKVNAKYSLVLSGFTVGINFSYTVSSLKNQKRINIGNKGTCE